jgi:hypothetical protein
MNNNENIDELAQQLTELKDKINHLRSNLNKGIDFITEHCDELRNEIELKTESIIQEIEKYKENLFQQIDIYEVECKKIFSNNENLTKDQRRYNEIIVKEDLFYDETKTQKSFDNQKMMIKLIKKKINIIDIELKDYHSKIFNDNKMIFLDCQDDIKPQSMTGVLKFEKIKLFDFNNYKQRLNIETLILNFNHNYGNGINHIFILDNGDFCVVYVENAVKMIIFDKNLHPKNESKYLYSIIDENNDHQFRSLSEHFKFSTFNNQIIVNYSYNDNSNDEIFHLTILDANFNIEKRIKCSTMKYSSICADCETIICLNKLNFLDIYDWNLNKIKTIGQQIDNSEPFFIKGSSQIETINEKIIVRETNKIRILDHKDGIERVSIQVKCKQMFLDREYDQIFIITKNEIIIYDLNGEKVDSLPTKDYSYFIILLKHKKNYYYFKKYENNIFKF